MEPFFSEKLVLKNSLQNLGIYLSDDIIISLLKFLKLVLEENKNINLTAIDNFRDGISKHIIDSLSILTINKISYGETWIDIGSGGGFPGVALAIANPKISMTLIESVKKKANFLKKSINEMGLFNRIKINDSRAELLGQGTLREKADVCTCRAVGKISVTLELGIPLLKNGAYLVLYKGPNYEKELENSKNSMNELKAELIEKKMFKLPLSNENRVILVFKKIGPTPKIYPRSPGIPAKNPL